MIRLCCAFLILMTTIGCGSSNEPTYKTTGSVKYTDGQSVGDGSVIFIAEGRPSARGVIEGGEYKLGTFGANDGAVAAKFRVAVTVNPPIDHDPDGRNRPPKLAHPKYSAPDTSGLEFEVTKGGDNRFDIELEREP